MSDPLVRLGVLAGALAIGACSNPTRTCIDEGLGIPALDLIGSLQTRGAEVVDLGERLDLTVFSVPTRLLAVNGEEVLVWEYCVGGGEDLARDLGKFGIGVFAEDPPSLTLGPSEHLWTSAQIIAQYEGSDPTLIELFNDVMGDELRPP